MNKRSVYSRKDTGLVGISGFRQTSQTPDAASDIRDFFQRSKDPSSTTTTIPSSDNALYSKLVTGTVDHPQVRSPSSIEDD